MDTQLEPAYADLLQSAPCAMFNHSIRFRNFLKLVIPEAKETYFLAYKEGKLVGALPTFTRDGPIGPVVNSLPFYGSHGAAVLRHGENQEVRTALFDSLRDYCVNVEAAFSTVVESPLDGCRESYSALNADFTDDRIGQITALPQYSEGDTESNLMDIFHHKTRNMVRKGLKSGFIVGHEDSGFAMTSLYEIHAENMRAIGGLAKPLSIFQAIKSAFAYGEDYRVYIARDGNKIAAAMLVFYFKDTVEYFTPAVQEKYRSNQPLSLLIFSAMRDAVVERSARLWNWGGTWRSQEGVYLFKSRWGTKDYPYRYHINQYRKHLDIAKTSKTELFNGYPYFFTIPFRLLSVS
ncbi:MAG TPA: GNAT family N-acetyltransferase [Polaromonas sp.]|uniref:GNAT family N-acetyltransferase n=1 Tax=Polaromonas sp. TaxID=1869339 RepID=UPI002D4B7A8F|nr:GNAT family N-acetyltransferase [Polaromonas sp.]HYW56854.1 GNAT family N-acetyltransferase [Polaromonas sp.]